MSGLRPPPTEDHPSRVVLRMIVLLILLVLLAVVIWGAVTNQRIPLVESTPLIDVGDIDTVEIEGTQIRVVERGASSVTTFLFHDADVAGSVLFDGVAGSLGDGVKTVAVDLPGFGFSTRVPGESQSHTVANMAARMVEVIGERSVGPVVLAGIGLGGEVAAEVAVTNPELVAGLVLIDVDFYTEGGWVRTMERLPWLGLAATHGFSTAHTVDDTTFAPFCDEGGWCPTDAQAAARARAASIVGTSASVNGFRTTEPASDVPARLAEITAPSVLIWSEKGAVPQDSMERAAEAMGLEVDVSNTFQVHLEEPATVADAIREVTP